MIYNPFLRMFGLTDPVLYFLVPRLLRLTMLLAESRNLYKLVHSKVHFVGK